MAWSLFKMGNQLGLYHPGQQAVPAGYPGFKVMGQCGSRGNELAWHGYNGDPARANSCFAVDYALTDPRIDQQPVNVPGSVVWITTFSNISKDWWGRRQGKISAVYYRPAGTTTEPVQWQDAQPAKKPWMEPWRDPAPQRTPSRGPAMPQRRPGIRTRDSRQSAANRGVIEIVGTGRGVTLRLNGNNRPPRGSEVKTRAKSVAAMRALHKIAAWSTEAMDFIEVVAIATGYDGPDGEENLLPILKHIAEHIEEFDPVKFVEAFILNEIEDQVVGRTMGAIDKQIKKLGLSYNPEVGLSM